MDKMNYKGKVYNTDSLGFLIDPAQWGNTFAEGMAVGARIVDSLTTEHWDIIRYIRDSYTKSGHCPTVYEVCKAMNLGLNELNRLFPTGYLRGACKLAGVTYKDIPPPGPITVNFNILKEQNLFIDGKNYIADSHGFLLNADDWDDNFAEYIAAKSSVGSLTSKHRQIINYLRKRYVEYNNVPTVYETCEANHINLDELEKLFPDGYHRGAVKIAGLRVR
jgi:tRNA 2-thiouridine synthesizing protein E